MTARASQALSADGSVHERPVSIHGESTRARAAAAVLAANMDAEKEAEEKEDKHRER